MTIYITTQKGTEPWIFNRRNHRFEPLLVPVSSLRRFPFPAFRLGFRPQLDDLKDIAKEQELSTELKLIEV